MIPEIQPKIPRTMRSLLWQTFLEYLYGLPPEKRIRAILALPCSVLIVLVLMYPMLLAWLIQVTSGLIIWVPLAYVLFKNRYSIKDWYAGLRQGTIPESDDKAQYESVADHLYREKRCKISCLQKHCGLSFQKANVLLKKLSELGIMRRDTMLGNSPVLTTMKKSDLETLLGDIDVHETMGVFQKQLDQMTFKIQLLGDRDRHPLFTVRPLS